MPILGAWSDVTPEGNNVFDRGPKDSIDLGFLFICRSVAVPRNQDDSMYVLEEMRIPVRSFPVSRLWVSEIVERITLLTDYERIRYTGSGKGGIIDPQLK